MIALVQAHARGVNWELWIALITPTLTILGSLAKWLNSKLSSITLRLDNQDKAKYEFEQSVNAQHKDLGERVSRLEGPLRSIVRR